MPNVTCPSCGEKGKIPPQFIGTRIKCKKCGNAFLVAPPAPKPAAPAATDASTAPPAAPTPVAMKAGTGEEIAVDGLDDAAWEATPVATAEHHDDHHDDHHDEATSAFTAHETGTAKQYKFLWSRDKFFESTRYDLDTIEQAMNVYARQGWVAKMMTTTHVMVRGVEKDQLVILMER